ncbi:hypothetical protein [Parashewanella tropica]|uniref:hypothetical protein n=1 Tax=Parashewanella tropica TaxID=2547970 RepID=UPI0010593EAF|nr:hypothetical protein [Parashewanella tropica]
MKNSTISLKVLTALYILVLLAAIWRFLDTSRLELFTLGVIPVLYGIFKDKAWTLICLRVYLAIQILGVSALAMTAIIAYQITPQDVAVNFKGMNIPLLPLSISVVLLLIFQLWVAFSKENRQYFSRFTATD